MYRELVSLLEKFKSALEKHENSAKESPDHWLAPPPRKSKENQTSKTNSAVLQLNLTESQWVRSSLQVCSVNSIFPEIGFRCLCQETGKAFKLLPLIDPEVWRGSCSPEIAGEVAGCQVRAAGCVSPLLGCASLPHVSSVIEGGLETVQEKERETALAQPAEVLLLAFPVHLFLRWL